MAGKEFTKDQKGRKLTQAEIDEHKDENGRLPEDAYTPETIGFNLNMILHGAECPNVLINDFLQGLQGLETTPLVHMVEGFDVEIAKLTALFTNQGATVAEVHAGAAHLQAGILEYNKQKAIHDGSKNQTLH